MTRDARDSIQAIGFVGVQFPRLSAPRHRPSRDVQNSGRYSAPTVAAAREQIRAIGKGVITYSVSRNT